MPRGSRRCSPTTHWEHVRSWFSGAPATRPSLQFAILYAAPLIRQHHSSNSMRRSACRCLNMFGSCRRLCTLADTENLPRQCHKLAKVGPPRTKKSGHETARQQKPSARARQLPVSICVQSCRNLLQPESRNRRRSSVTWAVSAECEAKVKGGEAGQSRRSSVQLPRHVFELREWVTACKCAKALSCRLPPVNSRSM